MKKLILAVAFVVALSGCASQKFNHAVENANQVKNGMTLDEAIEILGSPPNNGIGEYKQWRRGKAWTYTGRPSGAIEFHVVNGRIVDVPEGGIFSPAGVALAERQYAEMMARYERERLAQEEKTRMAEQANKEKAEKDRAERLQEMAAELDAAEQSIVVCKDATTCRKVFSLAQIYVQQNSDQKIQVATDTIIETYNPSESGKVGITVIKMPRAGNTEIVKITPQCNNESGFFERSCRLKRTEIYRGFKPFIEKSLSM